MPLESQSQDLPTPRPQPSYPEYQPEVEDIENEYDVILCYKIYNRWPKGLAKARKAQYRRKSKAMEVIKGQLYYRSANDREARQWVVNKETQEKIIEMLHIGKTLLHSFDFIAIQEFRNLFSVDNTLHVLF